MTIYVEIKEGEMARQRNVPNDDPILIPKLLAHGYLPIEVVGSVYDEDAQYLGDTVYGIQADKVVQTQEVIDYTAEELAANLEEARLQKLSDLYTNVKQFIGTQPNGFIRYDNDLKMNIMNAIIIALAAGEPEPEACTAVKNWIFTVQSEFFALKAAINDAVDLAELRAVDVSVDTLEDKYGREGTELVDPAISTDDLFA